VKLIQEFGMDTISLAGSIEAKLAAMKAAGFEQVMLKANDLVGHPGGLQAAAAVCKASGMRPTGFQVLRDFEGLSGHLHDYKIEIAKSMLRMAHSLGAPVLLACSSVSAHATEDLDKIAADLRKLAMLAVPYGIKIAYEALSWGRTIHELPQSWDVVCRADAPNLGLCVDSYHILAANTSPEEIDALDASKIFLVQLADFMWEETQSFEDRMTTARTFRVFPGEGVHSDALVDIVLRLDKLGYQGDYSFEVFNDDYLNLPLELVCERASRSATWLAEDVLRRSTPLPGTMRLKTM
jgi:sugar phosphate isomerase/epimerase